MEGLDSIEAVFVISLERREDRWRAIEWPPDWPLPKPERFLAVDGALPSVRRPDWWRGGSGAWGCWQSHLGVLREARRRGLRAYLVLEDDVIWAPDTPERLFTLRLPPWDLLYLGGQHLLPPHPTEVDELVRGQNINRTHAFAVHERAYDKVEAHWTDWEGLRRAKPRCPHHIDHWMGRAHGKWRTYCLQPWVAGQRATKSDVDGKQKKTNWWQREAPKGKGLMKVWTRFGPAYQAVEVEEEVEKKPFTVVLGLHRSGSSLLAGMIHTMGVSMGTVLWGHEGIVGNLPSGYEDAELSKWCWDCWRGFATEAKVPERERKLWVRGFVRKRVAAKYPMLLAMRRELQATGRPLRVVMAERPLEESVASLVRREGGRYSEQHLRRHQEWLHSFKEEWRQGEVCLVVPYHEVLKRPSEVAREVCRFVEGDPDKVAEAVKLVRT